MVKVQKTKFFSIKAADAAADIDLINQYSVRELSPEEVYCFSVILCDNDIDRDLERFTDSALRALAPLFLGKTGISDHEWSAEKQIARLYRTEVVMLDKENSLGEAFYALRGDAYLLNNEHNRPVIDAIDGGIMKEVSVGCALEDSFCSVCGGYMHWGECENGHRKGETYEDKLCFAELDSPVDAFEFSFVAVPAQRGAGVTKGLDGDSEVGKAFSILMAADLHDCVAAATKLMPKLQAVLMGDAERQKRLQIVSENKKILKGSMKND